MKYIVKKIRNIRYRDHLRYLIGNNKVSIALLFFCGIYIILFKIFSLRIGYAENAKEINESLESICFSVLAAVIFYLVNDVYRNFTRLDVLLDYISESFWEIRDLIGLSYKIIEPVFSLSDVKPTYTKSEYINKFENLNLYVAIGGKTREDALNEYRHDVKEIIISLIRDFGWALSSKDMRYLNEIRRSYFIAGFIKPMIQDLPPNDKIFYDSNQAEIGESIFELYHLKSPWMCTL